jgi:hypothetical protein
MSGLAAHTGTWNMINYQICDVALNCLSDDNPADIRKLFGTTHSQLTN